MTVRHQKSITIKKRKQKIDNNLQISAELRPKIAKNRQQSFKLNSQRTKIDKKPWKTTNIVKIPIKNEPFSWMFSKIAKRLFYDFWPASVELMVQSTSYTPKKTLIPTYDSSWPILLLLSIVFYSKLPSIRRSPKIIGQIGQKRQILSMLQLVSPLTRHKERNGSFNQLKIWRTVFIDPINKTSAKSFGGLFDISHKLITETFLKFG